MNAVGKKQGFPFFSVLHSFPLGEPAHMHLFYFWSSWNLIYCAFRTKIVMCQIYHHQKSLSPVMQELCGIPKVIWLANISVCIHPSSLPGHVQRSQCALSVCQSADDTRLHGSPSLLLLAAASTSFPFCHCQRKVPLTATVSDLSTSPLSVVIPCDFGVFLSAVLDCAELPSLDITEPPQWNPQWKLESFLTKYPTSFLYS